MLPSGFVIPDDAEAKLLAFTREEFVYYDGIADTCPEEVVPLDVLATFSVNSYVGSASRIRRVHRGIAAAANATLAVIRVDADLARDDWPREQIRRLLSSCCAVHGVGVAVATKVLHRKRPNLIPMLDSVIIRHYLGKRGADRVQTKAYASVVGTEAMEAFREDLLAAYDDVLNLQRALMKSRFFLTPVRVLEIMIWIEAEQNGVYRGSAK
jgi:hypothetical protein